MPLLYTRKKTQDLLIIQHLPLPLVMNFLPIAKGLLMHLRSSTGSSHHQQGSLIEIPLLNDGISASSLMTTTWKIGGEGLQENWTGGCTLELERNY